MYLSNALMLFVLRRENPPLEHFVFDTDLLDSPVAPKAEPGKIVINNLTHTAMKSRYWLYYSLI